MRLNRLNQMVGPDGVPVEGAWRLGRGNELQYRRHGAREEVALSGPLVGVSPRGLSFRVEADSLDGDLVGKTLELRGRWQADAENRLTFLAERRRGSADVLKLEGGWQVGASHEILYRVEREGRKGKGSVARLLRLRGAWEIDEDRQLTYVLDRRSDSTFRFRGAFQTASILAKEGAIRYQLGAELDGGRRRGRTVTLFGKWKLSQGLGLSFEIPYGDGSVQGINFQADFAAGSGGQIEARLRTRQGKPLGVEVVFSRSFLNGDGELFVRLRKELEETAAEAGLRIRW